MVIKPVSPPADLKMIQSLCWDEFGWESADFLSSFCNDRLWLARDKQQTVGFLFSSVSGKTGWIDAVYITPKYRGRGLASKLIKKVESVYRSLKLRKTTLYVRSDNPAQTLYFRLGYRVVDMLDDYYGKGIHALEMSKKLERT